MARKSLAELLNWKSDFGDYKVIGEGKHCQKGRYALCRCKCGAIKDVGVDKLRTGRSTCCKDCAATSPKRVTSVTHGMSKTSEFSAWRSMIQRCHNPNSQQFYRYGGRGIYVCQEWLDCFEEFFEDMGKKPSSRHSLDRIDNNKGYEKGNCRWALPVEQSANRRVTLKTEVAGGLIATSMLASSVGLSPATLAARLKSGWRIDRAISEPALDKNPVHDVNGRMMKASEIETEYGVKRWNFNSRLRKGMTVLEAIALG